MDKWIDSNDFFKEMNFIISIVINSCFKNCDSGKKCWSVGFSHGMDMEKQIDQISSSSAFFSMENLVPMSIEVESEKWTEILSSLLVEVLLSLRGRDLDRANFNSQTLTFKTKYHAKIVSIWRKIAENLRNGTYFRVYS